MQRPSPQLKIVKDSIHRFRIGQIDAVGLQQNLSAVISALEGDVPKEVSEAILKAEAWVDSIRFTVNESKQASEIEKVLCKLEAVLAQYNFLEDV